MSRRHPHILCFAPYTDWSIHSARQVTILQGLRQRGCSVTYVTCDGQFSDCDLLQASTGAPSQRPAHACLFCQARVATRLAGWGMPFRWLGQWLSTADKTAAMQWVQSLTPAQYLSAHYNEWPVGDWVKSSVHRHFRHNVLDLDDPQIAMTFASYLYSGVLACLGLARIFDEEKPDAQLLFNGRMAPTRIALELAKARGIRTICEERAHVPGRIQFYDNANCQDVSDIGVLWSDWQSLPLLTDEVDEIGKVLEERWLGRSPDVTMFSTGLGDPVTTWAALGFDPQKPLFALYTSSIDEAAGMFTGPATFANQYDWIDATVDYVAAHPEVQLAIRVHPNSGSKKSLGRNRQDAAYFTALAARVPSNVRVIEGASPISSYGLGAIANVGLTWFSLIGLELAALGVPMVRITGGTGVHYADFITRPETPGAYQDLLGQYRGSRQRADLSTTIRAWRYNHIHYIRRSIAFPLVAQPNWFVGEMAYAGVDALQPGRDASLDRICEAFISGGGLHPPAPQRSADISAAEKDAILRWITPYNEGRV